MLSDLLSYPLVGIGFGRHRLEAVRLRRGWRGYAYEERLQLDRENLLDPGEEYGNLAEALREAVRRLAVDGTVLRVVLPGPLVRVTVLRVEQRLQSRGEAEALVAWHAARQTGGANLRTAAHCLDCGQGDHHIYGIAVDDTLYRCLEDSLGADRRCALEMVETAATCRWNNLPSPLLARPGVLVDIHDDYWTLTVWNDPRYPLLVKSGWRGRNGGSMEADRMAREVFRLLASSAGGDAGRVKAGDYYLRACPEAAGIAGDALRETTGIVFKAPPVGDGSGVSRVHALPADLAGCPAVEIICARRG